ncbi:copper resistance protein C [Burkholderia multivorans]
MTFDPVSVGRKAAAVVLAATVSSAAFAHARPANTEPAANAELASAPPAVAIDFTETLESAFSSIVVIDGQGKAVSAAKASVDAASRKRMTVPLAPLASGAYTVKWVAVAADGHRTQGAYRFSVK